LSENDAERWVMQERKYDSVAGNDDHASVS